MEFFHLKSLSLPTLNMGKYQMTRGFVNIFITVLFLADFQTCFARVWPKESEEEGRHRFGFNGALTSSDTWQLETEYHFMFLPCAGVGGSLGLWKQYYYDGVPGGSDWEIIDDDRYISNLYLRPSLILISPTLFSIRDANIKLMAEPGIMMNVPYQCVGIDIYKNGRFEDYTTRSSSKGQWCAFDCRAGVNVSVGPINISAGYLISNLNIYGISRNIEFRSEKFSQFYPNKRYLQGAFLSVTCNI